MFQGGNTLGMDDTHDNIEVVTVDEHAAERWRESREVVTAGVSAEDHVIKTAETVPTDQEEGGDYSSILLPVDSKERRVLLRRSGVQEIDTREKEECRELRVSRQTCGCTCQLYCLPDTCPCARFNIACQVDRPGFPCGCTAESCHNKSGRQEFNPVKVRTHFVRTIMRSRLEEARSNGSSYLPTETLGYLAQMYTQQDSLASSSSSSQYLDHHQQHHHWVPATWSMDNNPWWTYSSASGHLETAEIQEEEEDNGQDTETSEESEEELYADVVEDDEEILEETVVTDEIRIVQTEAEEVVEDIVENVVDTVTSDHVTEVSLTPDNDDHDVAEVSDDHDEGISSDSCYEDTSASQTDSDSAKCEEDSNDRSEGFEDEEEGRSDDDERESSTISKSTEKLTSSFIVESASV